MKVDFIIVGAMKCATSSLALYLAAHPGVTFSKRKEPHFFSHTEDWRCKIDDYHSLFEKSTGDSICGEASTSYTMQPRTHFSVWDHIHEYHSEMRIIYLMRHPIDRIVSHYMHLCQKGIVATSLQQTLISYCGLLDFTRYYSQILPYVNRFGRSNVLLVSFSDLVSKPEAVLSGTIAPFLNLDPKPFQGVMPIKANVSVGTTKRRRKDAIKAPWWKTLLLKDEPVVFHSKPSVSIKLQNSILSYLEPEIAGMESLTGWDLSEWRLSREALALDLGSANSTVVSPD